MSSQKQQGPGVVSLQYVTGHKLHQARELRRSMTEAESVLWAALRRNSILGLKFRRQQVIEGFIVDFYCDAARLVVEVDGEVHERPDQVALDKHRRAVFESRGLRELRFKNQEVLGALASVLQRIKMEAEQRI